MKNYKPVALAKSDSYESGLINCAVESLFKSLNIDEFLRENLINKNVLIKPNLLMKRRPEEATTTHPEVLKAVIRHLQNLGITKIIIADSPGGPYTKARLASIYAATGMEQAAKETGAVLNFAVGYKEKTASNGKICRKFNLIDPVAEADFIISIGKLKTHAMTGFSGGVKNLFGCVPGLQKPELHYRFQKKEDFCAMLLDLAQSICPIITIIDAVDSMEGDGPSGGECRHTGFLCASESPFVLDRFLCDLIGFTPKEVPTVGQSISRELCPELSGEINIINPDNLAVQIKDFKKPSSKPIDFAGSVPKFLQNTVNFLSERVFAPKPVIQKNKCIGCGKCAESCPAKTIAIDNKTKKAKINLNNCIKCFCCHEMCPVKAISIVKLKLFKL